MRIQHNILAMNAYRNYTNNTSALGKNLEKLSSGYKINRAGDDAAGLAISEKMRAQITGLDAAKKNVKDGISLVKTAEGAMQEVQDMLNRMVYLATQSANGTYDSETDRTNLQKEVDALKTEIDRIADSANFNGINLLDGSLDGVTAQSAYTEVLTAKNINGIDRILSADISSSEKPWQVNGEKNIYDVYAKDATTAQFEIDMSELKASFKPEVSAKGTIAGGSTSINGSALGFSLTVKIGGQAITITASNIGSAIKVSITASGVASVTINAAALASAVVQQIKDTAKGTKAVIQINNVYWTASVSGSKVQFTQIGVPETEAECAANFKVELLLDGAESPNSYDKAGKGKFTLTGNLAAGTHVLREGVQSGAKVGAATLFNMQKSDIVDGTKIKLGDKTYTLAVGPNSNFKKATDKIDLTDMNANNIDLNLALSKISQQVGSTISATGKNADGVEVKATFKFGVSNDGQGFTVMRLASSINSSDDVAFDTRAKLAAIFSIRQSSGTLDHDAVDASGGLVLQIGDTSANYNQMRVIVGDIHSEALGISSVNIGTQQGAANAISTIKDAINRVSGIRGDLGAVQNRLEHTQNNLSVMAENIQDAESTIRDTDVAEEMMSYVKNNILVQSAQAMLAQANQIPQGVLQLLG